MGFFELVITLYIGGMTYLANLADVQPFISQSAIDAPHSANTTYATITRRMLYGLVAMLVLFGLFAVQILAFNLPTESLDELGINREIITPLNLFALVAIVVITGAICFMLISSENARQKVKRLTGSHSRYNPQSYVHLVAMVLALCLIGYLLINFVIAGGLQGVAEAIEENGLNLLTLIFQGVMFVIIALLGVGLLIRRTPKETAQRLGLTLPSPQHIIIGTIAGFIMIALATALTQIWIALVTPEQYAQQTSAAAEISSQIISVQTIFVLSLSAAVSEEILFRGAIQPVFGLPLTTLFFVSFHDQYTFSPAMLIILSVGLVLALLRRYQSTTSAIIAHFIYNFVPAVIVIAWPQAAHILGLL